MSLEDVGDLARRLSAAESVRRKLPQEVEKVREVMGKLSTAIRYMKKSEVFRHLENLSQEGRLFIMAKTQSEEVKKAVSNYITYADSLRPLVTGDDLKGMGVKEGPVFKDILDALKEAKIDRNLSAKEDELAFVRQYLSEKGIITGKSVIR
jgi:tRNA nucleotidyltransferase (CCA-adding enzyme)